MGVRLQAFPVMTYPREPSGSSEQLFTRCEGGEKILACNPECKFIQLFGGLWLVGAVMGYHSGIYLHW